MEMEQSEREAIRDASEEVSRQFKTLINTDDVDALKQLQNLILGRLQDSNAVLSHFNDFSEQCFAEISGDLSKNTRLLSSMKIDLDYIFQKLRNMVSTMVKHLLLLLNRSPIGFLLLLHCLKMGRFTNLRSMKAKIKATYPDAIPDPSTMQMLDQRPDLEKLQ